MVSLAQIAMGNIFYFLPIIILAGTVVFLCAFCEKKGPKFTKKLISVILWSNFGLHFAKLFLPYYFNDLPNSLFASSLPNFCAVLIVFSPFIFSFGNDYFKDYMYYMGISSAVMVYLFPTTALKLDLSDMNNLSEVIRFYLCHAPLLICPILMCQQRIHVLNYRRLTVFPFMVLLFNGTVFLNGVFFSAIHFPGVPTSFADIFNRDGGFLNESLSLGPTKSMDKMFNPIYRIMIPYLQIYRVDGEIYFTPVIWMLIPLSIATLILGPLLALPFEGRHMRMDIEARKQRKKMEKSLE